MCERRCLQVNVGNSNMMEVEKEVGFTSHLQVVDKNHQVVKELKSVTLDYVNNYPLT